MSLLNRFSRAYDTFVGRQDLYEKELTKIVHQINNSPMQGQNIDGQSAVYSASKILGETIGRLPLNIYKINEEGHKVKDTSDHRYDMLHNMFNNYLTSNQGLTSLEYTRNIKGNSFAMINRNPATGQVQSLDLMHPDKVEGYKVQSGELYYKIRDIATPVNANDLLHFRLITKDDGIWGLNPITTLRLNLSLTNQALNKLNDYYTNNLMTTKILKPLIANTSTKNLQDTIDTLTEQINGQAGRIITIPTNYELSELSLSFVDSIFIDTIKFNTSQVASVFGIPPHYLGLYEASKFNNMEQLGLQFKSQTLSAIVRMYEQEMMSKLLTKEERLAGTEIRFNIDTIVEYDYNSKINGIQKLFGMGAISPNLIQDMFGIDDVATEEEMSIMKKHFLMTNITTMENIEKIGQPAPQPQPMKTEPIEDEEKPEDVKEDVTEDVTEAEPMRNVKVQIKGSDLESIIKRGRPKK